MNRKQFQRFIDRDHHCLHCGTTGDTLVPQHRANRGHGGHKAGNQPANIIVLCAEYNGAIESNAVCALEAQQNGWKISRYENPEEKPVYDVVSAEWWLLGNDGSRRRTNHSI